METHMSAKTSDYVLSNTAEAERLRVQARIWEQDVERLLDQIGVRPGWRCLDLGCGAIGILEPLSRRVGPGGKVVGVDRDERLLATARAYTAELGLANVEILERDAFDTGLPRGSFDLVHARFIMAFGRASDLLREMLALTKPGGVVVSQETDQNSWCYFPQRPVWPRLKQVIEAAFLHMGGDANIGQQTYAMFRQAGIEDVRVRAAVAALQHSHAYMRMPILGATGMRKVILSAGLMSEAELDRTIAEMEQVIADSQTYEISFTVTQVWGNKPLI
jgi:ubiquinone/menaquinone biosynthesis C-methylase UbiE